MVLASVGDTPYNIVLLLHILAVIVAFAPAFVEPLLGRSATASPAEGSAGVGAVTPGSVEGASSAAPGGVSSLVSRVLNPLVHGGSLVLAGLFGLALIGMSDSAWDFSQTWISIALLLWFLMLAVFFAGLVITKRHLADDSIDAERRAAVTQRLSMFYGMLHLLLVLQLIDMIFKPGL